MTTLTLVSGKTWDETMPRPSWVNLAKGQGCTECDNPRGGPNHFGSPLCRSGSLATLDGRRAHCSCDACY